MSELRAGFIPLVDSAVLVVAARRGFAEAEGLTLKLEREASWATLRDKLTVGAVDCAHMLAPIPIASQLRIGHPKAPMIAPFALSRNGNAISVSNGLFAEMRETGLAGPVRDPAAKAAALAAVIKARAECGGGRLTFGMVHPFSGHNYELRYWLASAGIHPERDLDLVVIPPPFVVDYLAQGLIDGFCVGAPWTTVGVRRDLARTVVVRPDLWREGPEKVLAVREDFAANEPETLGRLVRALAAAAAWADAPQNRGELAGILSAADILDLDPAMLHATLDGRVPLDEEPAGTIADFVVFAREANEPHQAHALWFYSQMVRWGQAALSPSGLEAARNAFRPDIYRAALGSDARAGRDRAVAGFFDGRTFDPADVAGYLAAFPAL